MLTTFDRYLIKRYLHAFVVLFICTYGLFVVIDGFTNVDEFQQHKDSTADILKWMGVYYAFQSVQFFDMLAPVLAIVSTMVVLALLHKNSELQPVLAAGVPVYRLALPIVLGALLINGIVILNQELVIPRIAYKLQAHRTEEHRQAKVEPLYDSMRIHIRGKNLRLDENKLEGAEFMLPVSPALAEELTSLKAETATYLPEGGDHPSGWLLHDVEPPYEEIPLTDQGRQYVLQTNQPGDVFVVTPVSIDQLTNRSKNFRYLSSMQLLDRIRHPSTSLVSIRAQTIYFHARLVRPLLTILAIFVVVPLVLRRESRSLVLNMAVCAVIVGTLYGSGQVAHYLGHAGIISADLAAWSPAILNGAAGAWLSDLAQT